jgi:hypothetical protein
VMTRQQCSDSFYAGVALKKKIRHNTQLAWKGLSRTR